MRQMIINGFVGALFGNAVFVLWKLGHPLYGLLLFGGWIVGMINSLIPCRR